MYDFQFESVFGVRKKGTSTHTGEGILHAAGIKWTTREARSQQHWKEGFRPKGMIGQIDFLNVARQTGRIDLCWLRRTNERKLGSRKGG